MSNAFRELADAMARIDPVFKDEIRGATPKEIAALEQALGRPAPSTYKQFLEVMGNDTSYVTLRAVDLRISTVATFLKEMPWRPPDEYTLIGVDSSEACSHLYLDATRVIEERVVASPVMRDWNFEEVKESHMDEEAGSLLELVGGQSFDLLVVDRYPSRARLVHHQVQPSAMKKAEQWAKEQGFRLMWFSTRAGLYGQRADAAFWAKQPEKSALALKIGAASATAMSVLEESAVRQLDVVPYP